MSSRLVDPLAFAAAVGACHEIADALHTADTDVLSGQWPLAPVSLLGPLPRSFWLAFGSFARLLLLQFAPAWLLDELASTGQRPWRLAGFCVAIGAPSLLGSYLFLLSFPLSISFFLVFYHLRLFAKI